MENTSTIKSTFYDSGFIPGRMIAGSKSTYRSKYPDNEVYFNANIFVLGEGKIWFGDVDITRDSDQLKAIASSIGKTLYVVRELDGRFENENLSDPEIIKNSVTSIHP